MGTDCSLEAEGKLVTAFHDGDARPGENSTTQAR